MIYILWFNFFAERTDEAFMRSAKSCTNFFNETEYISGTKLCMGIL